MTILSRVSIGGAVLVALGSLNVLRAALPSFDFTQPAAVAEWGRPHHIQALRATSEGLRIEIAGHDPYFFGPPRDYPTNALWLEIKLRSDAGGNGQLFWFTGGAREEDSVRFHVPADEWKTVRLPLPALSRGTRLRIDPPGSSGSCTIAWLKFSPRVQWHLPEWPAFIADSSDFWLKGWGGFEVRAPGNADEKSPLASPHTQLLIGYVKDEKPVWFSPTQNPSRLKEQTATSVTAFAMDPDGARWRISQRLTSAPAARIREIEITVLVDQDREVIFLPLLFLVAGQDTNKAQALFPGLEYLDNEPSSSEADLVGPAARRYVPDTLKLTQTYIAMAARDRWFSLMWEPNERVAAFFDSPDRTFGTGRHVLGLLFPGSDGVDRIDGDWLPQRPSTLKAHEPLTVKVAVTTGEGDNVAGAAEEYVRWRGLPSLPEAAPTWNEYFTNAVAGWLDSKIREGDKVRHAVWQGFAATHAADAAVYMHWLASQSEDATMIGRLTNIAAQILAPIPPGHWNGAQVSHVRMPLPALVFGHVGENQRAAGQHARALLDQIDADGMIRYRQRGEINYGKTHYTNHANGLVASVIATALEEAVFSGSAELEQRALETLRAVNRAYAGTVPRGAQTWEVPLHTPDILTSAYLVRANALAFDLTRNDSFAEAAEYWAWTGVPFVYLLNPAGRDIGVYSTIAVYGATQWKAPVWMGMPVQWCGLVYSDALYRWNEVRPSKTWRTIADGIAAAGAQITWPANDRERVGLLPDIFQLREQHRDGPAINPGTLQPNAARLFGRGPLYQCRAAGDLRVHVAGSVDGIETNGRAIAFNVNLWPRSLSTVLITGFDRRPEIKVNGEPVRLGGSHDWDAAARSARLVLQGRVRIEVTR